jgi:hypothetical protein
MSLNRKFLIWKEEGEREREREGRVGGWADQQSVIFKVRLGLGETKGRDRGERQRGETEGRDRERET